MTSELPIQCWACEHLAVKGFRCDAFPGGIPVEILAGADHREEFPGDGGIRFRMKNTDAAREDFARWSEVFGDASQRTS